MIPWVRDKIAESRLRWQNRKLQRNELIAPSASITTISADDENARPHESPTDSRLLDSDDDRQAPTTSALHGSQPSKRRLSTEYVAADRNSKSLGRWDFPFIRHHTYGRINAENDPNENRRSGLVLSSRNEANRLPNSI